MQQVAAFVDAQLPGAIRESLVSGFVSYQIPRDLLPQLPEFFKLVEEKRDELGVHDFAVAQSTLEEVFLNISAQAEREQLERLGKDTTHLTGLAGASTAGGAQPSTIPLDNLSNDATTTQEMIKVQCGNCQAMLEVPKGISVVECGSCKAQ